MSYNLSIKEQETNVEKEVQILLDQKNKLFIYKCLSAPSVLCISFLHV